MQQPERNDWLADFRKLLAELIAQAGPALVALGNDPLFGPLLEAAKRNEAKPKPPQGDCTPTPQLPEVDLPAPLDDGTPTIDLSGVVPDLPQLASPLPGEQPDQLDGFQTPTGCFGPDGASDSTSTDDPPTDASADVDEPPDDSSAGPGNWCGTPSLPGMGTSDGLMVALAAIAGIIASLVQQAGPGGAMAGIFGSIASPPVPPGLGTPGAGCFGGSPPIVPPTSASSSPDAIGSPGCFGTGSASAARGPLQAWVVVELGEQVFAALEARVEARMTGIARQEANLLQLQRDRQLRSFYR